MARKLWILSVCGGVTRNVAWISNNSKGWISVGLSDQQAKIQEMIFTDDKGQSKVDFRETHPPDALIDPHFTLHGSEHFHLASNKKHGRRDEERVILSGLVWMTHEDHEECSPWVRIVSNPVNTLKQITPEDKQFWPVPLQSEECSLCLFMDFGNQLGDSVDRTSRYIITAKKVILRARIACLPAQPASMNYSIRG
jgi:hypothetical protein